MNTDDINAGVEQISDPAEEAVTNPADFIPNESFPWENGDEEGARTSDPDDSPSPLASNEEAAASGQEEEKTEEQQALDAEIAKLKTELPDKSEGGYLRTLAERSLKGKKESDARVTELETEVESLRSVSFRPALPVDDYVAQGEPKKFWDGIAKDYPGYYEPMVRDAFNTHLNPAKMQSSPEYVASVMPILADVFANLWMPDFIQQTFGMGMDAFSGIIANHQNGQQSFGQPPISSPSVANLTPQQIAEKFNLDPEMDKDQIEFMSNLASVAAQVPQMQNTIRQMQTNAGNGTKQQAEVEANTRLETFSSMLAADRENLLNTALQALPRDANGQIKKEFAHLPKKIERLVKVALDEDANYSASRSHASKWFKQPGNVETAKNLAGGDLKKIYAIHQTTITQIAKEELAPYISQIRTQSQYESVQRQRQQPKGGTSPEAGVAGVTNSSHSSRPADLRARAQARLQSSR